jgi:hypothetical protein
MTDYHRSDHLDYAGSTFGGRAEDNRAVINRARQAAEALFEPKPRIIESPDPATGPSAGQRARKPRILSAVQVQPTRPVSVEATVDTFPLKPIARIPVSHVDRIRVWLKYGMTIPQVAKVYGVTGGEIERMLRKI